MRSPNARIKPITLHIPKPRFTIGILIGLSYSFVSYAFLYLMREFFRVFSLTEDFDMWILTESEVYFYNFFFAFVAVIVGQSVCFSFWLDRPRKIFGNRHFRRTKIINDQRFLHWYFLSWFSKLAFLFGILFGHLFQGGFHDFSLYPDYNFMFVMIVVVLFLQTWNSIRPTFRRKSFKWMLASAAIVSIVAFGLSRINLIDYKAINQNQLEKNKLAKTIKFANLFMP